MLDKIPRDRAQPVWQYLKRYQWYLKCFFCPSFFPPPPPLVIFHDQIHHPFPAKFPGSRFEPNHVADLWKYINEVEVRPYRSKLSIRSARSALASGRYLKGKYKSVEMLFFHHWTSFFFIIKCAKKVGKIFSLLDIMISLIFNDLFMHIMLNLG